MNRTSVRICSTIAALLVVGALAQQAVAQHVEPESSPLGIPGRESRQFPHDIYESLAPLDDADATFTPVPDRWRQFYAGKWYDPYNQNVLKGDLPIFGTQAEPWFFELGLVSDTLVEFRNLPIPVGGPSTSAPGSNNTFGDGHQTIVSETIVTSFSLIKGNTSFKPPDFEFRFTPIFNLNHADIPETGILRVDPSRGPSRSDSFAGILELFADVHLANISDRYDFISTRVGIQQFSSDFKGFIYNVQEPGIRVFGNADNNLWQYNLAYFRRLDKDTNSGLNTYFEDRYEDVVIANLYRQDTLALGHTMQVSIIHRADSAGEHPQDYDNNGFLVRPTSIGDERAKNISSTYLGVTGDGHFGRLNTSTALYYVFGSESHNQIARQGVDISAAMAAAEVSYDVDFIRYRSSLFWASGDEDAQDGKGNGFDVIHDNPNFIGGDLSFWQRQGIPLIGGGITNLVNRNSLIPSFRPGKEEGQANFVNPGVRIYNVGADIEVTPKFKILNNLSYLQFDEVSALQTVRQDGSIDREIGFDVSTGFLYRPLLNNNIQLRGGISALFPGTGLQNLYRDETLYTVFTNLILLY
jgi:hypothetical protein